VSKTLWQYRGPKDWTPSPEWIDAAQGSPIVAQLLYNRGIKTPENAKAFLDLENYQPTSGLTLPDMDKAIERINLAIDQQEPILIFGDFDVDGMTGTSVLYETLTQLGAKVSYYIPDRAKEGHGLNSAALIRLVSSRQLKLVISTDTGITNFNEVSLLNGLKVDCIITDHHDLPENLPPAVANLNPKRLGNPDEHPLGWLAGVGVAFKLCELLVEARKADPAITERRLDLVAIGTVADLAPLVDENRYLVHRGVQVLNQWQRPGIVEVLDQAGVKPDAGKPNPRLTSETIGFVIGPRLNALGRLDNATQAVELLTSKDLEVCRPLAAHLEHLNRRRQELCDKTFTEAETFLSRSGGLDGHRAIILASPDWHLGVIGIVASRLIEKYHVPTFLMVIDESKGEARCSARSIQGFNLHDAMIKLSDYFTHFGGHAGAGGFALTLDKLDHFKRALYQLTHQQITDEQMLPIVEVDANVSWAQVNPHLIELVDKLQPFGQGNPSPRFVLENIHIGAQRQIGADGRHLKLVLHNGDAKNPMDALIWNHGSIDSGSGERFDTRETYHFAFSPSLNTFNNVTKVQMIVEDYHLANGASKPQMSLHKNQDSAVQAATTAIPFQTADDSDQNSQTKTKWIDHRHRQNMETYLSQLLMPLDGQRNVRIYHEGRAPQIPFLKESLLVTRRSVEPTEELILWDLPPDLNSFQELIALAKPEVVHLVGGKYQQVPLYPALKDYMKLIYQYIPKVHQLDFPDHLKQEGAGYQINLEKLSSQIAATQQVIYQGLMVLSKLELAQIQLLKDESVESSIPSLPKLAQVQLSNQPNKAVENTLPQTMEWVAFQHALNEVGRFREWTLKSPLSQIKAAILNQPDASPSTPTVQASRI
jgi:single-stranded-DNA-specific exonuclease